MIGVQLGSLDDDPGVSPTLNVFVVSKAPLVQHYRWPASVRHASSAMSAVAPTGIWHHRVRPFSVHPLDVRQLPHLSKEAWVGA
jgi:hypothetical protein